jgi:hypothetical protein
VHPPDPPDRSLPRATGYSYALPGGWVHLELEPARLAASVRRAVSERVRREPRLAPYLSQLDRLLVHECAVAAAGGAERVSLLAEVTNDGLATAAATFSVADLPGAGRAPGVRAALRHLAAEQARAQVRDATATMGVVRLAQQEAVRRRWRSSVEPGGRTSQTFQLVVPWPGRPRVGLLTISSTAAPLWPLLEALFDACCATFHWTFDGPDRT